MSKWRSAAGGSYILKGTYILEGHVPVEMNDFAEWCRWFASADRCVAIDSIRGVDVSTVFLGIDYSFGKGPPLLFETIIFGGLLHGRTERYSTWPAAQEGHARMVKEVANLFDAQASGERGHPCQQKEDRWNEM